MVGVLWRYSCGGGDLRVEQIIVSTKVVPCLTSSDGAVSSDSMPHN